VHEPLELTELQLVIMRVLWSGAEVSVADVHAAIERERGLALTTVATIMSRLEKAGLIARRPEGRHFLYRPLVSEHEVRRAMVRDLAERLFHGDVAALARYVLSESETSPGDLDRVRRRAGSREGVQPPAPSSGHTTG
jgi:predicted transcriptional regulator